VFDETFKMLTFYNILSTFYAFFKNRSVQFFLKIKGFQLISQ